MGLVPFPLEPRGWPTPGRLTPVTRGIFAASNSKTPLKTRGHTARGVPSQC